MRKELEQLIKCFKDFDGWLKKNNNYLNHYEMIDKDIEDSLNEIFNILLREPKANHFWYNYKGELTYIVLKTIPQAVPVDSLRIDEDKIKIVLRNIKLESLGI
jgi:hypothetical protein